MHNHKFIHLLAASLLISSAGVQAASLAVTPGVVANDFSGKIQLDIADLAGNRTVIIERFGDLNTNGVVDPGEPLLQRFRVRDGELPVIGGVRNLNMPGDEDGATNNQIRVTLFYPGVDDTMNRIEGLFLYRVSHPTNAFAPVTQPFLVFQNALPQGIRGRIIDFDTSQPLTNASVVLMDSNGIGMGGTAAVSNGFYTLFTQPGVHFVWPFSEGYVGDMSASMAMVSSNQFATNDFALFVGTNLVSGRLSNASNGVGVAAIGMMATSADNLFAFTFTDTNGNFQFKLPAGQWEIRCQESGLPMLGYAAAEEGVQTNITGSVSNVNIQVFPAEALIYGFVTDPRTNPVVGAGMYADDQSRQIEADGVSFPTNGAYCVAVPAGTWWVSPDPEMIARLGYISGTGTNVVMSANQAVRADFVLYESNSRIGGEVLDETNGPVPFVNLDAQLQAGGWLGGQSDGNGKFDFAVSAGQWTLSLDSDDAWQRGLVGSQVLVTVTNGESRTNITYRVRHATAQISGHVTNTSGSPLAYIGVFGSASIGGTNYSAYATTDATGYYHLWACDGSWTLGADCGALLQRGYSCVPNTNVLISGSSQAVNFTVTNLAPLRILTTNLSDGAEGTYYQVWLQAAGGRQPYNWSVAPDSAPLPFNLALWSNGSLAGNLMTNGAFNFKVQVTDANNTTVVQPLELHVSGGGPSPVMLQSPVRSSNGGFSFIISGTDGRPFDIEVSTDLLHWVTLFSLAGPSGDFLLTLPPQANYPRLFFRVRIP